MIDYNLSWIFYFQFNQKDSSAKAFFSRYYQEKLSLPMQLYEYDEETLKDFIHKYDYRKLNYFSSNQIKGYFDTLLRFKFEGHKGYLRTQSVCHTTHQGFTCMVFQEKDLFKMQHMITKLGIFPTSSSMVIAEGELLLKENIPIQMNQIKRQIVELLDRDIK